MSVGLAHVVPGLRALSDAPAVDRLAKMYRVNSEIIWRWFRRRGLEPEAAADLTQQVFLIAAERLADIRVGSERAFLLGTGLRLARTARRGADRVVLEDMDERTESPVPIEDLVDRRRAVELIDRVLANLTRDLADVFVLFELEGLSTAEIAEIVDVPLGTVASRLRRAREAFRSEAARLERKVRKLVTP
jgi:RNA polymerase sigma-70 factor (ECF subfamily)